MRASQNYAGGKEKSHNYKESIFLIQYKAKSETWCVSVLNLAAVKCTTIQVIKRPLLLNPYPTAFPYGNGMVLHFYQQQESSTTKTVHKVINRGLKAYV